MELSLLLERYLRVCSAESPTLSANWDCRDTPMDILDTARNFGLILVFVFVILSSVEFSRLQPKKKGEKIQRWQVLSLLSIIFVTVTLILTVRNW